VLRSTRIEGIVWNATLAPRGIEMAVSMAPDGGGGFACSAGTSNEWVSGAGSSLGGRYGLKLSFNP